MLVSKFIISPSLGCQSPDNKYGVASADLENHFEYTRCSLSISGYASYLWSLVFLRVSCGCSLGSVLRSLWGYHIYVVLSTMYRRHSSSSSVSFTILIHIDTSYAQNSNSLICA